MIPVLPTCFTGRTAQLAELHSRLMSDRHPAIGNNIAVSAAGGMGKSAMAAIYSTQYVNDYTWLLWVRGSNAGTMVASFRAAAAYIPLSEVTSATKDEEVVVMIRRWLGHENGWLMVVDGWDTVTKEMVAMLPMGQTAGDIIITTRLHSLCDFGGLFGGGVGGGSGTPLFLDVLEDDEALDYLLERLPTRREESEGLRKVVVSLGKMPLALELASAYLSKFETVSVSAYLKKLRVDRLNALQNLRTGDGEVVNQVLATYVPSIVRALETESQDMVKKIVSVIGFVDGSGVEADLLRLLVVRRRHGEEEGAGEDDFDMALSVLRGLSVLKVKGKSVSVHELVQDVCRTMAFASEEDRWKVLLGIGTALKEEIEDVEKIYSAMEWSRKIGVHGMKCLERMVERKSQDDVAVWLGVRLAQLWQLNGQFGEAMRGIEMGIQCLGKDSTVAVRALATKAGVFHDQGAYGLALELLLGLEAHPLQSEKGAILNGIAAAYKAQGDYPNALSYYKRALDVIQEALGSDHPSAADTLNNMGIVFRAQGDYTSALEHYNSALSIKEKSLGAFHPSTGDSLNNIACVFRATGEYERSLEFNKRAHGINLETVGELHPSTGKTLNNIALVYYSQKKYSFALDNYMHALTIRENFLGSVHPLTGQTLYNIANVMQARGEYRDALEYYERALSIRQRSLGRNHQFVGQVWNNMATLFRTQGIYTRALECYERALSIRTISFSADHPDIIRTRTNIALVYVYLNQRDHNDALAEYCSYAISIFKKLPCDPYAGDTLILMAIVLYSCEEYDCALECNLQALTICKEFLEPHHSFAGHILVNMAILHEAKKNYTQALECFTRVIAIYREILSLNSINYQTTLTSLNKMVGVASNRNLPVALLSTMNVL